jgi:hypothetical protein
MWFSLPNTDFRGLGRLERGFDHIEEEHCLRPFFFACVDACPSLDTSGICDGHLVASICNIFHFQIILGASESHLVHPLCTTARIETFTMVVVADVLYQFSI